MDQGFDGSEIPRLRLFRNTLAALAAAQGSLGFMALLFPSYFYEEFPFGRGWVEAIPAYNEHLVRDVGGLFLATAVMLGLAALWLERRLVIASLLALLAFAVPHYAYHLFNLEPYSAADLIGNVVSIGATVVIPIFLLALLWRKPSR